jgi:hypothetical protein
VARIECVGSLVEGVHSRSNLFIRHLALRLALPFLGRAFGKIRLLQE